MLSKINNILNGDRNITINKDDIKSLMIDNINKFSPSLYLKLVLLLNKSLITSDDLLHIIITIIIEYDINENIVNNNLLVFIGLALKYDADPNIYIINNTKYNLIDYIIKHINNKIIIDSLILILLLSNAIIDYDKIDATETILSVIKKNKQIDTITTIKNIIDIKYIIKISIILDNPSIIDHDDKNIYSSTEMIRDHSSNYLYKCNEYINYDFDICLKYLNLNAYKLLISKDIFPSYSNINDLILLINNYNTYDDTLICIQLQNMLSYYLLYGGKLDPYQYTLLSINKKIYKNIKSSYVNSFDTDISYTISTEIPSRKNKYITGDTDNKNINDIKSERIRILAFILHINPFLNIIDIIKNIKTKDILSLKKSVIKYKIFRDAYNIKTLNEYKLKINEKNITNIAPILDRIKSDKYNEIDIIYYKDSNDITWYFTNDMFDELLKYNNNIYFDPFINSLINSKMDSIFIAHVNTQRSMIKRLGIPVTTCSYDNNIDMDIELPNIVDFKSAQKIRDIFYTLARMHNVTPNIIESLDIQKLNELLKSIDSPYYNLNSLECDHARMTFYKLSYSKIQQYPEIAIPYFAKMI
uniref:Uncharacterized protein n=1 Tax=Pithovirus LCPAC102 TaxID=2506587 RepID=A0A481Z349_9VIRU|nr:MAG: hypothetical protein LCPAC102_01060 [Pithovirus LCPAC102]